MQCAHKTVHVRWSQRRGILYGRTSTCPVLPVRAPAPPRQRHLTEGTYSTDYNSMEKVRTPRAGTRWNSGTKAPFRFRVPVVMDNLMNNSRTRTIDAHADRAVIFPDEFAHLSDSRRRAYSDKYNLQRQLDRDRDARVRHRLTSSGSEWNKMEGNVVLFCLGAGCAARLRCQSRNGNTEPCMDGRGRTVRAVRPPFDRNPAGKSCSDLPLQH
ncbi:hypothetical protein L209DRAFT_172088 [Thermothelomyces heterothallicus CBS 203.75]